jgi:hypothetical protein|tara:strand:+ start:753 stop:962 length:210 start_codon:yes stop_codon:yes gene_type:complete
MGDLKIYEYCFAGGYNVVIIAENKKRADEMYDMSWRMEDLNLLTVSEYKVESGMIIFPDEYCLDIEKKK